MYSYDCIGNEPKCLFCHLKSVKEIEHFFSKICFEKAHLLYVWKMEESNGLSEIIS